MGDNNNGILIPMAALLMFIAVMVVGIWFNVAELLKTIAP